MDGNPSGGQATQATGPRAPTVLDQAVWSYLRQSASPHEFAQAWLALVCQFIGGVQAAALVMPDDSAGRFVPFSIWPEKAELGRDLTAATERAMAERQGVLREMAPDSGEMCLAYPYMRDDRLTAVVALRMTRADEAGTRRVMRQLQWAAGWIELLDRRQALAETERERDRGRAALEVLVSMLERRDHKSAAMAVATATAAALGLERVGIGMVRRRGLKLTALSHSAELGTQLMLSKALREAMLESLDQGAPILRSTDMQAEAGEDPQVSRAHEALIRGFGAMSAFTLPLYDAGDQAVGAMTLESRHPDGIPAETRDLARGIAALVGPILHQKRLNDRPWWLRLLHAAGGVLGGLLGPSRMGLKLFVLLAGFAVFFFSTATTVFEVTAEARLEGQVQRVISAPFDGYLVEQAVRPGDRVVAGDVLAQLDDQDIRLQLLAAESELQEHRIELNAAVAAARRTDQALLQAQIDQVSAQRDLLLAQLDRSVLRAPFDGVVVSGDRSQELGSAVERGEELFIVAPLGDYRLRLMVAERDIAEMQPGQTGQVRFSAQPDEVFPFAVNRILPVAQAEGGANRFAVEALMERASTEGGATLLPGMEGIARVAVDRRLLVDVWTRDAVEWLRLFLWRWKP